MNDEVNSNLSDLALKMLLNAIMAAANAESHKEIYNAVKFFMGSNITQIPQHFYKKDSDLKIPRIILIIGNGATKDAIGEMNKEASVLAESIEEKMRKEFKIKDFINEQKTKLQTAYNLDIKDFETRLTACATFNDQFVRNELKKEVDYKYVPSKFYEIVGHLFKHRYIDAIINFNYDEILDNIIEEEMGDSDYHKIFLDGHCPKSMDDIKAIKMLKAPIYVKPHGTISYDSSLLFTKEHYHNLPTRLREFIKNLFVAEYGEESESEILELNLIVAGFAFRSVEFNQILNEAIIKRESILNKKEKVERKSGITDVNLYVFDIKKGDEYFIENNPQKFLNNINVAKLFGKCNNNDVVINKISKNNLSYYNVQNVFEVSKHLKFFNVEANCTSNTSLGNIFEKIWNITRKYLENPTEKGLYRGIERHMLINKIFYSKDFPQRFYQKDEFKLYPQKKRHFLKANRNFVSYCHDRIVVELIIIAKQSRDLININIIKESRVSKYFELYIKCISVYNDLRDKNTKKIIPMKMEDFLTKLGYIQYKGYTPETYQLTTSKKSFFNDRNKNFSIIQLQKIIKTKKSKTNLNDSEKYFKNITRNSAYRIKAKFNEYKLSIFDNIRDEHLLYSDLKWAYKFNQFFVENGSLENNKYTNWNVLLCISDSGAYLSNYESLKKFGNKYVELVLPDYFIAGKKTVHGIDDTDQNYFENLNLISSIEKIPLLPWWLLNQHIRLFVKLNSVENYELIGATYYQSRLMSKEVRPVLVSNESDLQKILKIFIHYWVRASIRIYNKREIEELKQSFMVKNIDYDNPIPNIKCYEESLKLLFKKIYANCPNIK